MYDLAPRERRKARNFFFGREKRKRVLWIFPGSVYIENSNYKNKTNQKQTTKGGGFFSSNSHKHRIHALPLKWRILYPLIYCRRKAQPSWHICAYTHTNTHKHTNTRKKKKPFFFRALIFLPQVSEAECIGFQGGHLITCNVSSCTWKGQGNGAHRSRGGFFFFFFSLPFASLFCSAHGWWLWRWS